MKQAQKKFTWYAVAAVFVLLTVLLGIINGINFTMASQDADRITQRIAEGHGAFGNDRGNRPEQNGFFGGMQGNWSQEEQPGGFGPMGPTSPEMQASMRYFTAAFDKNGTGSMVSYQISAVSEEEALAWAATLTKEGTGWTRGTYRYRVYKDGDRTLVTVIDHLPRICRAYVCRSRRQKACSGICYRGYGRTQAWRIRSNPYLQRT